MSQTPGQIEEKTIDAMRIAGVRMQGRCRDCPRGFAQIGRRFGRHICGPPFLLHYNTEYREENADFEACMPISMGESAHGVDVRELPGGRCVSLLHEGPYERLHESYAKIRESVQNKGCQIEVPTREIYHQGPGMILKGNPENYLTEIQMLFRER